MPDLNLKSAPVICATCGLRQIRIAFNNLISFSDIFSNLPHGVCYFIKDTNNLSCHLFCHSLRINIRVGLLCFLTLDFLYIEICNDPLFSLHQFIVIDKYLAKFDIIPSANRLVLKIAAFFYYSVLQILEIHFLVLPTFFSKSATRRSSSNNFASNSSNPI